MTPFLDFTLRRSYLKSDFSIVTETLTLDAITADRVYSGVGGRFININYEAMPTEFAASSTQITLKNSVFSDIIADGDGAFA